MLTFAVACPVGCVVREHLRIHEIGGQIEIGHRAPDLACASARSAVEVGGRHELARTTVRACRAPQHFLLQLRRKAAVRAGRDRRGTAAPPTRGMRRRRAGRAPPRAVRPLVTIMMRHVAHHLGGRRHLHDVAEHLIDLGVGRRDLRPAVLVDAERARLLAQIGVLAARACRARTPRRRRRGCRSRRRVAAAHLLPVVGDRAQLVRIETASRAGRTRSASTIEPRFGCEVRPLRAHRSAPSTASAPASMAASTLAAAMPLVSCVWKWIGSPVSSLSALTRACGGARLAQARPCP